MQYQQEKPWFDYTCMTLFSVIGALYLILPIFLHTGLHLTENRATDIANFFVLGLAFGQPIYKKLIPLLKKTFNIKPHLFTIERYILTLSGLCIFVMLLFFKAAMQEADINFLYALCLGLLTGVISPLNIAIINFGIKRKSNRLHASMQRWLQNIGIFLMYLLFCLWDHDKSDYIFITIGLIIALASLFEIYAITKTPVLSPALSIESETNEHNEEKPAYPIPKKRNFFITFFLSMVIFMQIPTSYAYFLYKYFSIGYSGYAKLMMLNVLIVILLQFTFNSKIISKYSIKMTYAIGISLIGIALVLPLSRLYPTVIISFILWTVGEIFFFTSARAYLINFTHLEKTNATSLSISYYMIFLSILCSNATSFEIILF